MNLNNLINKAINNFIIIYDNRLFSSNFNEARYFTNFFHDFFDLVYLRNLMNNLNNFFMNDCNFFNTLFYLIHSNRFFTNNLNLSDFLWYIRNYLFYLTNLLLNNWFLLYLCYFLNCCYLFYNFDQFLFLNWNLNNFLYFFFDNNKLFHNLIASNRHLEWNNNCSLNFNNLLNLYSLRYKFLCYYFFGYLYSSLNNLLFNYINWLDYFSFLNSRYDLFNNNLNLFNSWNLNVFNYFNLDNLFLNYRNSYLFYYLYYFLYNPRYDNNFFDYFFNLNNLRNFNQFFNYFIDRYSNLFYSFDNLWYLNYLLDDHFHWLFNCYIF